jgi:transcriptional regulator with XRE-family HTH domain
MTNRLGTRLRDLRRKKGVSLRRVERETGVSNAYLSQLERGVAMNPTPAKLQALAEYFEAPYLDLLSYAGYLPDAVTEDSRRLIATPESGIGRHSPLATTFAELTDDEETLVLQYVEFLKSRRDNASKTPTK